jgi:lysozyme
MNPFSLLRGHPKVAGALGGAVLVAAAAFITPFEGLFTSAYKDPVGVWTICIGHVEGVKPGDRMTEEQCRNLLASDLPKYDRPMMACLKRPINDAQHVAFLSFTYNVGVSAFCNSTLVRKHNAGAPKAEVCRELLRWDKATDRRTGKRITLPGLTKRRRAEEALCLKGAA